MERKIVFGKWEAATLIISLICTKMFANFPRLVQEVAGTAGWIMTIYVSAIVLVLFMLILKLYDKFEGYDIIDVAQYVGGNTGRIIIGILNVILPLYIVPVILRVFAEEMKLMALTVSPISYVIFFFLSGMVIGAFLGLESIVRLHAVFVPVIAAAFILILILVSPYMEFNNIFPILGSGAKAIFFNGSTKVSIYAELLFLFFITPYIKSNKTLRSAGYIGIGLSTFFLTIGALGYNCIMPYPTGTEQSLPIYHMARLITYGRFFQRIESVFLLIWAAAALLYLTSGFYFIVHILQKTFRLKYYKPIVFSFAILVFNLSLLPPNLVAAVILLETEYFRNWAWIITFGATILLLLAANLKKRYENKPEKGKTNQTSPN